MSAINITNENFENEVMNSDKPVILDFWAGWCGPCQMLTPIIDEIAEETKGSVKVGKINVDEESDLARRFQVMSIPTIVSIKDGEMIDKIIGVQSKETILNMVK